MGTRLRFRPTRRELPGVGRRQSTKLWTTPPFCRAARRKEPKGFMKIRMPALVQRLGQRVPEEFERMTKIIFGLMGPCFGKPVRGVLEKMPQPAVFPDALSAKGNERNVSVNAAFFPEFPLGCFNGAFAPFNRSLDELTSGGGMPEGQHFGNFVLSANDNRASFLEAGHPSPSHVWRANFNVESGCCGVLGRKPTCFHPPGVCMVRYSYLSEPLAFEPKYAALVPPLRTDIAIFRQRVNA